MAFTILLADDSVTIRRVVELTFHDTEIRVETAATGREALELLDATRPDLVLADVLMPPPTGYELCRSIKNSDRPVPVLLLTGAFEPFDEERARSCGADGHITKPFESGHLRARVEALLRPDDDAGEDPPVPARPAEPPVSEAVAEEAEPAPATALSDDDVARVARAVIAQLSDDTVREIAWEVVPELAESAVRERIRQIESDDTDE